MGTAGGIFILINSWLVGSRAKLQLLGGFLTLYSGWADFNSMLGFAGHLIDNDSFYQICLIRVEIKINKILAIIIDLF